MPLRAGKVAWDEGEEGRGPRAGGRDDVAGGEGACLAIVGIACVDGEVRLRALVVVNRDVYRQNTQHHQNADLGPRCGTSPSRQAEHRTWARSLLL